MRVLFTKNHHVPVGERSRRLYKRDHEYDVPDEVGKATIEAKAAKRITEHAAKKRRSVDKNRDQMN